MDSSLHSVEKITLCSLSPQPVVLCYGRPRRPTQGDGQPGEQRAEEVGAAGKAHLCVLLFLPLLCPA